MPNSRVIPLTSVGVASVLLGGLLSAPSAYATMQSGNTPRVAVALNQDRLNQETENFEVGAIDGQRQFVVKLGSLVPLREYLSESLANFMVTDYLVIGRIRNGACKDTFKDRQGPWTGERSSDNSSITVTLNMNINLNGKRYWKVGSQPCVRRVVTWVWPEESEFLGIDLGSGPRPTTARSDYRLTPNTIPARQLVAAPPIDDSVDVELITPDVPGIDTDLQDIDPGALDGPEIVLPDFIADDESADPVETLLGGVPEDTSFNTPEVRAAVVDLRNQFRTLAGLLGVGAADGGNPGLQQEAIRNAAANPQNVAQAIARARSALNTITGAASTSSDQAAAEVTSNASTYSRQLDNFANAAPVGVAGGVVSADKVGAIVGFNTAQSPIAGTTGSGAVTGLTLTVKAPATVKAGKKAKIVVSAKPGTAKGVLRIALVRKTKQGLQMVGAKQVKLRNGKANTTVTASKKAGKGPYTLMVSLVPSSRTGTGITVQRPIRIN